MKKIISCFTLALLASTLLISACGWQLRGTAEVPKGLSQLYVAATDHKDLLTIELKKTLKANRVTLVDNSQDANYTLTLNEESKDRRTVSVGSDALSSAYELTLKVAYEIRTKNTALPTKATAVSVRSFSYNTASISSAAQEEALLISEMRRDLVQQMLRRLNSVVTHSQTPSNSQ